MDDFAVFILTHGRPDNAITEKTLRGSGYTGPILYLLDDEDTTADRYREKYGDRVRVFAKSEVEIDTCDQGTDRRGVVFARNAVFDVAEKEGVRWFLVLDDDYRTFQYRLNDVGGYGVSACRSLDEVFAAVLRFYQSIPAKTVTMAQGGDFIGGSGNPNAYRPVLTRKAMNTFFCSTDRRFSFMGRTNEDTTAYVTHGARGDLFFTIPLLTVVQRQTQACAGGLTETYLSQGTYVKSFYTVMNAPSCTKVAMMGDTHMRLHHKVSWKNAVPVIVHEKVRKT